MPYEPKNYDHALGISIERKSTRFINKFGIPFIR